MAAPWTWDITKPDGSEAPGTLDTILQTQVKVPLDEFFKVFSNWPTTGDLLEGTARITVDTYGNIPAAGTEGKVFFATDTGNLYVDNGTTWTQYTPGLEASEFSLFGATANDSENHVTSLVYATLPTGLTWAAADGISFDRDLFSTAARFRVKASVFAANATSRIAIQLYDATAAAVVAGSEIISTTYQEHGLRSNQFDITAGVRKLRVQAKINAGVASAYVRFAVLEVNA